MPRDSHAAGTGDEAPVTGIGLFIARRKIGWVGSMFDPERRARLDVVLDQVLGRSVRGLLHEMSTPIGILAGGLRGTSEEFAESVPGMTKAVERLELLLRDWRRVLNRDTPDVVRDCTHRHYPYQTQVWEFPYH